MRRGAVLIAVLVCLTVLSLIVATAVSVSLAHRREVRRSESRLQAEWLAESGLERAWARLAAMPDYAGETWELTAQELGGRHAGVVRITVSGVPERPRERLVRVQADFPRDSTERVRHSKEVVMNLEPAEAGKQP